MLKTYLQSGVCFCCIWLLLDDILAQYGSVFLLLLCYACEVFLLMGVVGLVPGCALWWSEFFF